MNQDKRRGLKEKTWIRSGYMDKPKSGDINEPKSGYMHEFNTRYTKGHEP